MLNPKEPTRPKSETNNPMRFMIFSVLAFFRFAPSGFRLTLLRNLGARLQTISFVGNLLEFFGRFHRWKELLPKPTVVISLHRVAMLMRQTYLELLGGRSLSAVKIPAGRGSALATRRVRP